MCRRRQVISEDKDLKFRMKIVIDEDCPLPLFGIQPTTTRANLFSPYTPTSVLSGLIHFLSTFAIYGKSGIASVWQQYFKVVSKEKHGNAQIQPEISPAGQFQFSQILKLSTIKGQIRNFHSGRTGQKPSEKVMQEWQKSESKSEKVTVRGGGRAGASLGKIPV